MVFLKNYSWGSGCQYKTSADTVGKTLERIEERDGAITKESFLEESRPVTSPTHEMFEWDNDKAAEKYRLVQSGRIIGNLVVTIQQNETDEPVSSRAVVNIVESDHAKAVYQSIGVAMSQTDTREIVLNHALNELKAFKAKYAGLKELAELFKTLDRMGVV